MTQQKPPAPTGGKPNNLDEVLRHRSKAEAADELVLVNLPILRLHWADEWNQCSCDVADCERPGLHPMRGYGAATEDFEEDSTAWDEYPDANIGIITGLKNWWAETVLVVLSVDNQDALEALTARWGRGWMRTLSATTPTGGKQYYYQAARGWDIQTQKILPGVSIQGAGGFVPAPPSTTIDGAYKWDQAGMQRGEKRGFDAAEPLPEVIFNRITNPPPKGSTWFRTDRLRDASLGDDREEFNFHRADELDYLPAPKFLIEGVLEEGSLAMISGKPAGGKTFVALGMACSIATGTDFVGHATAPPGYVLYLISEGQAGMSKRIRAWAEMHGIEGELDRLFVLPMPLQMAKASEVERFRKAIRDKFPEPPKLIVVDTFARSFVGGDENSATDIGLWIDNARSLIKDVGAAILVVHHTGKSGESDPRGSSAILGGWDALFSLSGPLDAIELRCRKQRDNQPMPPVAVKLAPVGQSLALTARGNHEGLSKTDQDVLEALEAVHDTQGPVRFAVLQAACKPLKLDTEYRIRESLKRLAAGGKIVVEGNRNTTTYRPAG